MWPFTKRVEKRDGSWDRLQSAPYMTASGGYVSPEKASGLAVAHRCIQLISENLASVPLRPYRRSEDNGREPATDHPLYRVLHDDFNESLTAFAGREMLVASVLTAGNGYARIERSPQGQVVALHPIQPGNVSVEKLASGRLRYQVALESGGTETLLQDELIHLRYRTKDGIAGLSPLSIAAATFSLALAQQDQAAAQVENAFSASGMLSLDGKLTSEQYNLLRSWFRQSFIGSRKAGEPVIMDNGAKFTTFQIPNKDMEFLESRYASNEQIAMIFGCPPTSVGLVKSATYSNVEGETKALVARCLGPMSRRIEQAMNSALLTPEARRAGLYIEHDLGGLLRGDLATRYEAYRVGREGGWLSPDEIRAMENMSKIPGGDTYLQPMNHVPLGTANDNGEPKQGAD